jgi:hypothetical protein
MTLLSIEYWVITMVAKLPCKFDDLETLSLLGVGGKILSTNCLRLKALFLALFFTQKLKNM